MTTIECPWCDGPVALPDESAAMACDACGVVELLAADPRPVLAAAA